MNKFVQNLTKNETGIKEARAKIVGEQAENAQSELINTLKREKNGLNLKLDQLQDLAPNDTTSLVVAGGKTFDPQRWVRDIQDAKVELATKEIELDIAQKTYDEWFKEIPAS